MLAIGAEELQAIFAMIANKGNKPRQAMVQEEATVPGNKDKSYKLQPGAADRVHVQLWRKEFDRSTGEPLFEPWIQIFEPRVEWKQFLANRHGLTVKKILHLPEGAITVEKFDKDAAAKLKAEVERNKKAN